MLRGAQSQEHDALCSKGPTYRPYLVLMDLMFPDSMKAPAGKTRNEGLMALLVV